MLRLFHLGLLACLTAAAALADTPTFRPPEARVAELVAEIDRKGRDPVDFVLAEFGAADLIVFDEGLHNAVEPWAFYGKLVADARFAAQARYVFIEVIPYNAQGAIDAYLDAADDDPSLLWPALQAALETGWSYRTYVDFFAAVRRANESTSKDRRIRVIGVAPAAYWPLIATHEDYVRYRRDGFAPFDEGLYARILMHLDGFESGRKGIFLTNTRHAYTGLKRKDGNFFWNAGTYFRQRHPGKTRSIRFNAPFLEVKDAGSEKGPTLGSISKGAVYGWTRADGGAWDAAFALRGDKAVALPLVGTVFGTAPYLGNQMLSAAPGQTLADVYDAVIHLRRLEDWRQSARETRLYTPAFRREVARRLKLKHVESELDGVLKEAGVATVEAYVGLVGSRQDEVPLGPAQTLQPLAP